MWAKRAWLTDCSMTHFETSKKLKVLTSLTGSFVWAKRKTMYGCTSGTRRARNHARHASVLSYEKSLYLLVLSGREKEDADAQYWLSLINSFAEDSPVIVVLNKIREHPFTVNQRGLKATFANLRDALETDCEDGTGIEALRAKIFEETDRLEHLRDPFPAESPI